MRNASKTQIYFRKSARAPHEREAIASDGDAVIVLPRVRYIRTDGRMIDYRPYLASALYGNPYTLGYGESESTAWLHEQGYKPTRFSKLPKIWQDAFNNLPEPWGVIIAGEHTIINLYH